MHMPSIAADCLAILALTCTAPTRGTIRVPPSSHARLKGGILLALGLLITFALPILTRLPWAELADEAFDQAIAVLRLLEAVYVILTL